METMLRFGGLDWATDPKNRAAVMLEATAPGRLGISAVHSSLTDQQAVELCSTRAIAVIGIDIPFGWPEAFSKFVAAWTPTAPVLAPTSEAFRFRHTDQVVGREVPKNPLSVSADRIALGARAWAALLTIHELQGQVDVEGRLAAQSPTLIEVYPGASAKVLGRHRIASDDEPSYKKNADVRRSLVRHVAKVARVELAEFEDTIVREKDRADEADAFLAAVTAAIYASRRVAGWEMAEWGVRCPEGEEELAKARREGWAFFPVQVG